MVVVGIEFVVRDRADLVGIRLAERADDVDVARAGCAGTGVFDALEEIAKARADAAQLDLVR